MIPFLLFFLVGIQAGANISGDWQGTGYLQSLDGKFQACEKIELSVTQTESALVFKQLNYHCDTWELRWATVNAEIRANEVFYEGVKIGSVGRDASGDFVDLNFLDLENKLGEKVVLRVKNGVLSLYDELYALDRQHTYSKAEGELGPK